MVSVDQRASRLLEFSARESPQKEPMLNRRTFLKTSTRAIPMAAAINARGTAFSRERYARL
jgi:hypothetical protein